MHFPLNIYSDALLSILVLSIFIDIFLFKLFRQIFESNFSKNFIANSIFCYFLLTSQKTCVHCLDFYFTS